MSFLQPWAFLLLGLSVPLLLLYFLKVRLLGTGPALEKKEWVQLVISVAVLVIGTMNVRLAARRAERRKGRPE